MSSRGSINGLEARVRTLEGDRCRKCENPVSMFGCRWECKVEALADQWTWYRMEWQGLEGWPLRRDAWPEVIEWE